MRIKTALCNFGGCTFFMLVTYFICSIKSYQGVTGYYFESDFSCSLIVFVVWLILFIIVYFVFGEKIEGKKNEGKGKC